MTGSTDFTNVSLVCFVLMIVQVASSPMASTTEVDVPPVPVAPTHDQDVPATKPTGPPVSDNAYVPGVTT